MKNKNIIHPATVFFLLWWFVAVLSWIGSVYAWDGIRNIISTEALRWFLRYTEEKLMSSPALYLVLLFFMSVGLFLHSGLGGLIWRMVRRERKMSGKEKKSLVAAVMIAVAYFMVYALLAWGPWNIVRGVTGRYVDSPLHDGALCILAIGIGVTSMVYGYSADHYRSDTDVVKGMSYMFSRFPSYLVSLFFVIQFMVAFEYSGFPVCFGMTECLVDITYWICCLIPLFWEFYYKS
ncbi:AbgT family transporter [Bacteroides caecigallinarum]|uniref:AbgT family transporter n=1 Tax=Bacteroides caecigallinarum TaxID=1411144 RepID=UPI001959778B|nr:AbgT family transporter [Bacteroides caecigallinarum]MBM6960370.1 AbgT family transporter [Bacteroides caecigallinarum]